MRENLHPDNPIGVFDSGVGGLTVVKALKRILPKESIIYLGDTAKLPYGTKSPRTIINFAYQNTKFLLERKAKLIVVACHTVSSVALEKLTANFKIPIIGVIEAGAKEAAKATRNNKIGVIGTTTTINSGEYEKAILKYKPNAEIVAKSTPVLVPLVEEGWTTHIVTQLTIKEYLASFKEDGIDTLLLGCTHYPLLKPLFQNFFGSSVSIVDPGNEIAKEIKLMLEKLSLLKSSSAPPVYRYYFTDITPNLYTVAENFLGEPIKEEVIRATIRE